MNRIGYVLLGVSLAAVACDDFGARVIVEEARTSRDPEGRAITDVDVRGVEHGGGNVGAYCVTAHFFPIGVDPTFVPVRRSYAEAVDHGEVCGADLEDGDVRTVRFFAASVALPAGTPVRVQARTARELDSRDVRIP